MPPPSSSVGAARPPRHASISPRRRRALTRLALLILLACVVWSERPGGALRASRDHVRLLERFAESSDADAVAARDAFASLRDVAVWSTAAGGAAAVTVGGDGVLAATRFDAALGSARDSAWPCVGGGGEAPGAAGAAGAACVAVAVCDRAGLAVTLAEDQAEVRVWDLATERLVRAARFERGGARGGGGGGGRGGRRARALAAIGGTNGRVVGVYRERGREEDGTVVQIVRGR